ncbi:MAG: pentapeptide repeat-containing protein [Candidatus Electrothrix sp. YB6]
MANREQLNILWRGVAAWNAWREEHPDAEIDLSGANLDRRDLSGANFRKANVCGVSFISADLVKIDF